MKDNNIYEDQDIYSLDLHESLKISFLLSITRVPGGWIYTNMSGSMVFVKYQSKTEDITNGFKSEK